MILATWRQRQGQSGLFVFTLESSRDLTCTHARAHVRVRVYLAVGLQQVSGDTLVVVAEHQLLRPLQDQHLQRFVLCRQESRSEIRRPERRLRLYDGPQEADSLPLPVLLLFLAGVLQGGDGVMVGAPVQASPPCCLPLPCLPLPLQPLRVATDRRPEVEGAA